MRKIRIAEHISVDGVIQPGGPNEDSDYANGGWSAQYRTAEGAAAWAEAYGSGFDLLLGRRTYDLWASFWPKVTGGPFADSLNAATKYVATHRPDSLEWGPVGDLGADVMEGIRRLKSQDGPDLLVCGSASLTSALLEQGWVDEVVLAVYPLLLGRGKRCFSDGADPRELALVSTKTTPTGVLLNTYRHVGSLRTRMSPTSPDHAPQMGPDERAVREVHSAWIDAVNAGDLARLLTLMADDVVFLNPGQAPFGQDGFSAGFSAAHQRARIHCISELEEVVVVGDVAYARSQDSLSVTPVDGEEARLAGHRITIYRKEPDGRWVLARDAHTLSPVEKIRS